MTRPGSIVALGPPKAETTACAWCGLRKSIGLHQGTECCRECKDGGRVFRVRMSMARWKRGRGEAP